MLVHEPNPRASSANPAMDRIEATLANFRGKADLSMLAGELDRLRKDVQKATPRQVQSIVWRRAAWALYLYEFKGKTQGDVAAMLLGNSRRLSGVLGGSTAPSP
jgi:hypothetical protein